MKKSPLNRKRVDFMHKIAKNPSFRTAGFNCLNAVMYALEVSHQLEWSWDEEIDYLIEKTKLVSKTTYARNFFKSNGLEKLAKPKKGDILCFYDDNGHSIHFAIYTGKKWFNKRGGLNTAFSNIQDIISDYDGYDDIYIDKIEIRRILT